MFGSWIVAAYGREPVKKDTFPMCPNCKAEWHGLASEYCRGSLSEDELDEERWEDDGGREGAVEGVV